MARNLDPEQMAGELVQLGRIVSVDHAAATCTVEIGDLTTGELPWLAPRAGALRIWSPPTVGEQVLVLAAEGDLANGVVLPALWSDAHPAPSDSADVVHLEFADGAILAYDVAAHALTATLPGGGTAAITAPGGLTITGDVTIEGDVTLSGTLTADTDVIGGGKSLKGHRHTAVTSGTAQSGPPA